MAVYKLNEGKMFSDIADGIAIIINSETGVYYGMNVFGTNVFDNLLKGVPTEAILAELRANPVAPEDIEDRFDTFIKALLDFEIILEGNEETGSVDLDQMIAQADDFELKVDEFTDAQELLLADPIHEVKNETGWKPEKDALETEEKAQEKLNKTRK